MTRLTAHHELEYRDTPFGRIPNEYHKLHGVDYCHEAIQVSLPEASEAATLRAVFQATEIGMLNMSDLLQRAKKDIEKGDNEGAAIKIGWLLGYERVLNQVSRIPEKIAGNGSEEPQGYIRITDSPSHKRLLVDIQALDKTIADKAGIDLQAPAQPSSNSNTPVLHSLKGDSILQPFNRMLHQLSDFANDVKQWEARLAHVAMPTLGASYPLGQPFPAYEELIRTDSLNKAAKPFELNTDGDALYLRNFSGLHLIPEILMHQCNRQVIAAGQDIGTGNLSSALRHLQQARILLVPMADAIPAIKDNLSFAGYSQIREILGTTSGSHSNAIRKEMFLTNYPAIWKSVEARLMKDHAAGYMPQDVVARIREVDANRDKTANPEAMMMHQILNACAELRNGIMEWRENHLQFARMFLGVDAKSLSGSYGTRTATQFVHDGHVGDRDPMHLLLQARRIEGFGNKAVEHPITDYAEKVGSLDYALQQQIAGTSVTVHPEVNERTGFYTKR